MKSQLPGAGATRHKGGVYFDPLLDGSDHVCYDKVLGYNTGRQTSVQELLLREKNYTMFRKMKCEDWKPLLYTATKMLLEGKTLTNPRLTVQAMTTIRYWYNDNWYGDKHSFVTLRDAKRYALQETGMSVTIYDLHSNIVCIAPASGYCPP